MQNRFNMTGKGGYYVESKDENRLKELRKIDSRFKGRHIKSSYFSLSWDDIVLLDVIYPPEVNSRMDLIKFNRSELTLTYFKVLPEGDVLALFPYEKWDDNGNIASYQHVGQHGGASPALLHELPPATPEQYKDLYNELLSIGYSLNVKTLPWLHFKRKD